MEKYITKVEPPKVKTCSNTTSSLDKGKATVLQSKSPEDCDKKNSLNLDTQTDVSVPNKPAHVEAAAIEQPEDDDEEFVLRLQSSDEEIFQDAVEDFEELKEKKTEDKTIRLEKYFSDIESSDDSQGYELNRMPVEVTKAKTLVSDKADSEKEITPLKGVEKDNEPEFEPVESDEEDFECSTVPQTKETVSDAITPCDVEDSGTEVKADKISNTLLFDDGDAITKDCVVSGDAVPESVKGNTNSVASPVSSSVPVGAEDVDSVPTILEECTANEPNKEEHIVEVSVDMAAEVNKPKSSPEKEETQKINLQSKRSQEAMEDDTIWSNDSLGGEEYLTYDLADDDELLRSPTPAIDEAVQPEDQESDDIKVSQTQKDETVPNADKIDKEIQGKFSPKGKEINSATETAILTEEKLAEKPEESVNINEKSQKSAEVKELLEDPNISLVPSVEDVEAQTDNEKSLETIDESLIHVTNTKDPTEVETLQNEAEQSLQNAERANKTDQSLEIDEINLKNPAEPEESLQAAKDLQGTENNELPEKTANKADKSLTDPKNSIEADKSLDTAEKSVASVDSAETSQQSSKITINNKEPLETAKEKAEKCLKEVVIPIEADKFSDTAVDDAKDEPGEEELLQQGDPEDKACKSLEPDERPTEIEQTLETTEKCETTKQSKGDPTDAEISQKISNETIDDKDCEKLEEPKTETPQLEKPKETLEEITNVLTEDAECLNQLDNTNKVLEVSQESKLEKPTGNDLDPVEKIFDSTTKESSEVETTAAEEPTANETEATTLAEAPISPDATSDVNESKTANKTEKPLETESVIFDIDDDDLEHQENAQMKEVAPTNDKSAEVKGILEKENPISNQVEIEEDSKQCTSVESNEKQRETDNQPDTGEKPTVELDGKSDIIPDESDEVEILEIIESNEKQRDTDDQPDTGEKPTAELDGTSDKKSDIMPDESDEVEILEIIETTDTEETTDNSKPKEDIITDDTTMKSADNGRAQDLAMDDEEPLLVIDTSHKDENENEDNDMDTETEQTATSAQTTDSSSDGSLELFYDKPCVNYECKHESKNFYRATLFSLNYYKISKKRCKAQFVCEDCYDRALDSYEEMCRTLTQKQPLLLGATFKGQEFVEIIDSSDEEDSDSSEKIKESNPLPKESIDLLEAELEGAIRKVMHNVEIQNQLSWTKQILQQRLYNLEEDTEFVSEQLRLLQKKADSMHNSLYQCPKIKIRQLTPLDLNSGRSYNPETESTIPPMGEVVRTPIHLGETYYAVKNKAIASWVPCKVIEAIDGFPSHPKLKHYKIKFLKSKYPMLKTVSAKHMAFFNPPKVRLPIGTRVIAYFDATSLSRGKEKMLIPSAFYPGIVAEPLKQSNKFRYLVFYDDGYFQYVYHKDVRLVCQASEHVWEDVHHQSREFIHSYLTQYAVNRPMVQTQKGQSMLVDYNGKWIYSRVIDVDCSLVQMLFEGQSRSEWIYRGSTRLGPVYKESNNLGQKNPWSSSRVSRRTEPFIRYFNGDDTTLPQQQQQQQQQIQQQQQQQESQRHQPKPGEVRSVAKKSVSRADTSHSSQPAPTVRHLNNSIIFVDDDNKPKGKVVYYTARKNLPPRDYVQHICSPSCPFTISHNLLFYSPLAKPLLSGWERQVFRQKSKKFIVYRGPCGKRMRTMEELHRYLRVTDNELNVDNFDFSAETNCLAEYVIESCIVQKKDISNGKEKMPIPCVNYYDNTMPPDCIYSSRRIPTEGVPLNLDREFLVGCDCEDDCSDKSKCSCWELTYAGAKYGMPNVPNEMVGYQYKRLYEHVPTGIYECNSRCKCKANCVNRVVQQPLQSKLQVFKTSNRGWGLRCINDVPRGSFICIYAGHLLTEQKANEGGLDAGDEYFAELDYIEVAEQIKEGYESDVPEQDEDEELYNPRNDDDDDDDDEFVAPGDPQRSTALSTRVRTRRTTKNSTDAEHDSQERQVISFEPKKMMSQPDNSIEKQTIRKLFGRDEACYIMDAKVTGNLGRYFNHSCSPNLFVQNVFVDTHDLRFPWVAFFAFTHIRAGTELTWNYNYEVGVVPGKVLYCQCGAPNCRQRLL